MRHRLFSAQKPAEKRALREHDQQLREEMGALLTGAGWGHATARQLAAWDPYNQNASSPFFDPAWMFGITDGFDVVIGNPPYKSLTKNNTESNILSLYLKAFDSIKKASSKNIFTLFIEQGINLSKNNSVLSFIIPEGLFITRSYKECVEKINHAGSINLIATFEDFVFENAITGNIIFLFTKGNFRVKTRQIHFDKDYNLSEKKEGEDEILKTIVSNDCRELKEMATLFKGMVVSDRSSVVFENKELGRNDIFLLGKSISKYAIIKEYYTHYADLTIAGGTKKKEKHDFYPRILIRRTGDSLCCAFLEKPALTESTLYSCWSNDGKISSKYLLALLNSKLLTYYIQKLMITNKQAFPQILMTDLESLPIKISNNQKFFIDLVDQILAAKQRDPAADTSALEAEIDRLVYALYGLTDEEIAIVGGK
ncbi:MAG: TaqI-like C-terminal specificity domain-containing protein [Candidatus Vecturithrix sp.]|nr:TaqI-like C-terminal specificity domain-containing protein [Candidatus Vecturithrix sp.]